MLVYHVGAGYDLFDKLLGREGLKTALCTLWSGRHSGAEGQTDVAVRSRSARR